MQAYACRISKRNLGAIASEHPKFDLEETLRWLEKHGSGYFIRDEETTFDCSYMEDTVFLSIYRLDLSDDGLFRRIFRI